MSNSIKYSTNPETLALKTGDFWIGTGDVPKGPTSTTGYWNGITPPSNGYTIYLNKTTGGPSMYIANNDSELITITNQIANTSFTTVQQCFTYYSTQNDKMVFNQDYPPIVTDGLVLNLDAGFRPSYPTLGTTWFDLSGNNNNGTLVNGPTFDSGNNGSFVFDGVNDYADIGTQTPNSLTGNKAFSVCGWFKRNGDWSGGATWGIGGNNTLQGINSFNSNKINEITIDLWGTSTYTTNQTYSLNEWKYIVWTYNGTSFTTSNIIIYINLVPYTGNGLSTLRGGSGTPNINTNGVVLGRAGRLTNQYYGKPNIAYFSIYSKVLTELEITQNYNATKGRFGL